MNLYINVSSQNETFANDIQQVQAVLAVAFLVCEYPAHVENDVR